MKNNKFKLLLAASVAALVFHTNLARAESNPDDIVRASNSLAGNYLAARIASTDKDTQSAATFYRKALELDQENSDLQMRGFLNFIANGNFSEGVRLGPEISKRYAMLNVKNAMINGKNKILNEKNAKLNAKGKANKDFKKIELIAIIKHIETPEIVNLILAVEDLRKKTWANAERRLSKPWRSALDRLMAGLVMGWVKLEQDKLPEALKYIDGLKGPEWFDLFVQYHGGLIALSGGDAKDAVKRLEKAFANRTGGQGATETYMRTITALAQAHWKAGDKEKAANIVQEGLNRAPQSPVFERMKTNMDADKAPGFIEMSTQRGAAEVFLNLGTALNREGGQQFARIYMQLAKELAGGDDVVVAQLAQLFDKQGMLLRANSLFETIEPSSPLYRIARLETALNYDELEELDKARGELDKLLVSGPDDLVAHLSYGAVLARHEKYKDAITIYNKIIARISEPKRFHWNLFYRVGIAYERTDQWEKAEAAFKKSLKLFPDQPNVLNYLGYSWVDKNINLQEGLDMIRKAVQLRPNDGYIVDSLGWAYFKLKRYEEAVVEMERSVGLRPGDPTINDHLGDAYWMAKRKLEATFQWQHALALEPAEADIPRIEDKLESGLDAVIKKELAAEKAPNKG